MDYNSLQIFLPAFMAVFFGIISVWAHIRKNKKINTTPVKSAAMSKKVKIVDILFQLLLLMSITIAMLYAYFPEYYRFTGPIDLLDHPVINTIGVLVLKISLFWMILAQFNIERTIAMINSGIDQMSYNKLLSYSEKLILSGMLIMFFGFFITISSIVAILICIAASILFDRLVRSC
jgi:hypothetical protein